MRKYIHGWCIAFSLYFLTLFFTTLISYALYGKLASEERTAGAIFSAVMLLIIPYTFIGLYARNMFSKTAKAAFWMSIIFWTGEKIVILLTALYTLHTSSKLSFHYPNLLTFIQAKALPFYNLIYITSGLISITLAVLIASNEMRRRAA
ncbi:hypothetical protein LC040_04030 [Bacillus tianshenii]|nr:hypothetical protein LC040_04030 [Bacillus tianshenii]